MSPLARRTAAHLVLLAPLLAACVPQATSTRAVLADREKFLNERFDPSVLRPGVRDAFKVGSPAAVRFKRLEGSITAVTEEGNKTETAQGKLVLLDAGDGMVKAAVEYSRNDIPYRLNQMLSYRNLVALRWVAISHAATLSQALREVVATSVTTPGIEQPVAGREYVYKMLWGLVGEGVAHNEVQVSCKVGETVPASTVAAGLPGDAVELACENKEKDVLVGRERYRMVPELGVAFMAELTNSRSKTTFTLADVKIER
jgi:hypothetical protein